MQASAEGGTDNKKGMSVAKGRTIGVVFAALILIIWHGYPKAVDYWDRKAFEVTVEKTLAERGIATAEDNPKTKIQEYGVGDFKGRRLPAIVVKVDFLQVDKVAGEKTQRCLFMYALYDKEFEVYRNYSLSECDELPALAEWKTRVKYR